MHSGKAGSLLPCVHLDRFPELEHLALFLTFKAWSLGVRRKTDSALGSAPKVPSVISSLPFLAHRGLLFLSLPLQLLSLTLRGEKIMPVIHY